MQYEEWPATYQNPVITMALQRILETLQMRQRKRKLERAVFMERQAIDDANSQVPGAKGDAAKIGDEIKGMSSKETLQNNDAKLETMGITPNNVRARPQQVLAQLTGATQKDQAQVQHTLSERGELTKISSF